MVHRPPSVRTTGIPMFTLTHSNYFGSPLIAHQCCEQLTAVKTRYTLASITWPYRGLRCRPIQFEYFSEVIRWQVTSFQMIAGSFLIHMKYVVFISLRPSAINILISVKKSREDAFHFSHHSHALVTLHVQFLCCNWSKFDRWVHTYNLCPILRLFHFDSRSWQSFVSTFDVFNCLFPLDVQNEIQLLSRVFCYSWLVYLLNFWLRNAPLVKVGNPISDGIVFVFHLAGCVRE